MANQHHQLTHPTSFGLLRVSGPEAKKFLQGQLTCNLDEISETQSHFAAHCNPQGRILFLCRVFYFVNHYYLLMPQQMIAPALSFLRKYALFFKLELNDISREEQSELKKKSSQEWAYFDIRKGIPHVYPLTSGKFLPHEINLHQLDAISWDKGCYTGQEIIARMHYRGKLKNHLYRAKIHTTALPQPGSEVYLSSSEGLTVGGIIVDCYQEEYNIYQLLIMANENKVSSQAFVLDPNQNETWEWL